MIYELAKKLKDAGFSQEPITDMSNSLEEIKAGFYWTFPTEGRCGGLVHLRTDEYESYIKKDGWTTIKSPTLSELVEACGDGFDYLFRKNNDGSLWIATTNGGNEYEGSTPEIAVANLWLELNKK